MKKVHNYARGAAFERRVLKYLIGDNTHITEGHIHRLMAGEEVLSPPHPYDDIYWYGTRMAGSRGDFDLNIIGSKTSTHAHVVLGIQCKLDPPSEDRMLSDLRRIYKTHGITGVYATRPRHGQILFTPSIDETLIMLVEEVF